MPLINYEIEQGSDEWFAAKLGKPSASGSSKLVTSKGAPSKSLEGYAQDLAVESFTKRAANEWSGNAATEFGNIKEASARSTYEFTHEIEVVQAGFIEDDLQRYLISPDGLVGDNGLLEIKCKPKLHLATLLYYKKHNKIPTDYISQLQMQLLVSEREWVDLYYYSEDLPCLEVRVYPDAEMFKALQNQLALVVARRDEILKTLEEF